MIKKTLLTGLLAISICAISLAQTQDIKVTHSQSRDSVHLIMENQSHKDLEIKIELKLTNQKGYSKALVKTLKSGESMPLISLGTIRGKRWTYNYTYWTKRVYSEGKVAEAARLLQLSKEDVENALLVFDKDGCSRCDRTLAYLKKKKIPHSILNITESDDSSDLMYRYLYDAGFNAAVVTTPVIVIKGEVHYSIPNLEYFVGTLKRRLKK